MLTGLHSAPLSVSHIAAYFIFYNVIYSILICMAALQKKGACAGHSEKKYVRRSAGRMYNSQTRLQGGKERS